MLAAAPATRRLGGTAILDAGRARALAAGMLGYAAVRPLVGVELVPPCPLRSLTGIPCPLCGMTRGVTALVHGDVTHALRLNPGALLVVTAAIVLLVQWRMRRVTVPVWIIVTMLAVLWAWQLVQHSTGRLR